VRNDRGAQREHSDQGQSENAHLLISGDAMGFGAVSITVQRRSFVHVFADSPAARHRPLASDRAVAAQLT